MRAVEKSCGIEGRLLRPLSAKLLSPTIPETEMLIDREKLLKISGRSRAEQRRLAAHYGITDFQNAAGGCLLTDKNFGRRLKDAFEHGCQNLDDTVILKWGRHFRLSPQFKTILAHDEHECEILFAHAQPGDYCLQLQDQHGPIAILQGDSPSEEILSQAAGLIQYFSRYRGKEGRTVEYWQVKNPKEIKSVTAAVLELKHIESRKI